MLKKIFEIINSWDPIEIGKICPQDEYLLEASEIQKFLNKNADISAKQLSKFISNLFSEKFGNDIFSVDENKIIEISKEILESKCNWNINNRFWKNQSFFFEW